MSYEEALEAAGAEIIAFEKFGSYQGDWWCLCKYENEIGWVTGSFGSCSGCDAFEQEFNCDDEMDSRYPKKLAEFGKNYLEPLLTQEQALKQASTNLDWDDGAKDMLQFIKTEWEEKTRRK